MRGRTGGTTGTLPHCSHAAVPAGKQSIMNREPISPLRQKSREGTTPEGISGGRDAATVIGPLSPAAADTGSGPAVDLGEVVERWATKALEPPSGPLNGQPVTGYPGRRDRATTARGHVRRVVPVRPVPRPFR
ncbi:hypothetical protein GCM10009525_79380 [Streptosporangium amethystogenes subsp. fukuiense]